MQKGKFQVWPTKPLWTEVFLELKLHYEKYKDQLADAIEAIETIVGPRN